jgi:hypothetical protein
VKADADAKAKWTGEPQTERQLLLVRVGFDAKGSVIITQGIASTVP